MLRQPRIVVSVNLGAWPMMAAAVVETAIRASIARSGTCHIMLTGGHTASRLYSHWAEKRSLPTESLRIFYGDERCVPSDHPDSNHGLVLRTLFADGRTNGCTIVHMRAGDPDRDEAARSYDALLPGSIDVLLLGVGSDGHIASLFPKDPALLVKDRRVVKATGPKAPFDRLTISPTVISHAKEVFLLATGAEKGRMLAQALQVPWDIQSLPVRLTLDGTWLLDNEAEAALINER